MQHKGLRRNILRLSPPLCYTKKGLCLLSLRIFPSLCLAVAMPFLGRFPEKNKEREKIKRQIKRIYKERSLIYRQSTLIVFLNTY